MKTIGMWNYWNSMTIQAAGLAYLAERERIDQATALEAQRGKVTDINNRIGSFKNGPARLTAETAKLRDMTLEYNRLLKSRDKWAKARNRLMRGQVANLRKAARS